MDSGRRVSRVSGNPPVERVGKTLTCNPE
jgi:hypothetical protein